TLLLHGVLPLDVKALGKEYVKDKFRRHKTFGSDKTQCFLQEKECYGNKLKKTQNSTEKACFGIILPEEKHNDFGAEQIGQLQELMQEATKPNSQFSITDSMKPKI
ncbi:hypothetical protein E2I00_017154, partial [Balaenoptera physalus]